MAVESGLRNMVDIYWHVTMMRMKNIKPFVKWECFLYIGLVAGILFVHSNRLVQGSKMMS